VTANEAPAGDSAEPRMDDSSREPSDRKVYPLAPTSALDQKLIGREYVLKPRLPDGVYDPTDDGPFDGIESC
jgi:hypothetical protein